jgi:hypothetical protein
MPNPTPKTDQLKPHQWRSISDRAMGKVIGVRYPSEVEAALKTMPSPEMQQFIRDAVEEALRQKGLLS